MIDLLRALADDPLAIAIVALLVAVLYFAVLALEAVARRLGA